MRIAVDAMGGDFAPMQIVLGAVTVAREEPGTEIVLIGDEAAIVSELAATGGVPPNISVRHAPDVIAMHEHPAQAMRRKRNSSLVIAGQMVKSGEADATFSAGNTGAAMAIATLDIGRIPGIDRPAIATVLPTLQNNVLLLDAGANVDCTPQNLMQFALLGSIYAEKVLGRTLPRVGLLNIGSEAGKGNELTKATYDLLAASQFNFVGNIEGKDLFEYAADVVVCDGFAGNILLKTSEGVAELILSFLQRDAKEDGLTSEFRSQFGQIMGRLVQQIDYAEYGGAPLLGVNGVSMIGHGRSKSKAIASAIRAARAAAASGYVAAIRDAAAEAKNV